MSFTRNLVCLAVRNSIPIQGTDAVIPVQVVTVPTVVLKSIQLSSYDTVTYQ